MHSSIDYWENVSIRNGCKYCSNVHLALNVNNIRRILMSFLSELFFLSGNKNFKQTSKYKCVQQTHSTVFNTSSAQSGCSGQISPASSLFSLRSNPRNPGASLTMQFLKCQWKFVRVRGTVRKVETYFHYSSE